MYAVILAVPIIITIVVVIGLHQKNKNAVCKSKRRLDGKVAIVTGGTAGIGLEISTDFAHRGAKVIIACPFEDEGTRAENQIRNETGNEKVVFKRLDLGSLNSVRNFAADVLKCEDRLDILVNNAGVGVPRDFYTADGLSFIMQVNYFGHFLLTLLLLPLLKSSGKPSDPSRIVNASSLLHRIGRADINNMNKMGYWYRLQMYGNSKFCMIPFARELTKRLRSKNVVINSADPGVVGTKIFESGGQIIGILAEFFIKLLFKTPWDGAQTAIYVAIDSKAGEVSGEFFENCLQCRAVKRAYDDKMATRLWEESVRLVGVTDEELEECFK